jgi:hypothetical protein
MRRFLPFALLASAALLAAAPLSGCAGPAGGEPDRPAAAATPQQQPTPDELRRLRRLAEVVVVGTVDSYDDAPAGRTYTVRVSEVLSRQASLDERKATHPVGEGEVVKVSTFLFRDVSQSAEIGPLEELSRYVFFLSPTEDAGEWLNLEDPASLRLPEAQATLDALRGLRAREEAAAAEQPPG